MVSSGPSSPHNSHKMEVGQHDGEDAEIVRGDEFSLASSQAMKVGANSGSIKVAVGTGDLTSRETQGMNLTNYRSSTPRSADRG